MRWGHYPIPTCSPSRCSRRWAHCSTGSPRRRADAMEGKVVSLLPAATEIVAALGATNRLTGVSHECDYPPEVRTLPCVTRTSVDTSQVSGAIDRAMAHAKASGVSPIQIDEPALRRLAPH